MKTVQHAPLTAVVLAAGQGTRMKSSRPKVLHELCGRPMAHYVIDAALTAGATDVVVVVGHGRDEVSASLDKAFNASGRSVRTALQPLQQGTGDAVRCAMPHIAPDAEAVLILCGDTPLLDPAQLMLLRDALTAAPGSPLAMFTTVLPDPTGYGRVLRDGAGGVVGIREQKDASAEERQITEVTPGVYLARTSFLRRALESLTTDNAQGEFYLTDIVLQAAREGGTAVVRVKDVSSLVGINDRAQLAAAEEVLYGRIADTLRRSGVTVRTSARIDASVAVEPDAVIEHGVVLRGATRIGAGARIDVGSVLTDVVVDAGAVLKPYSIASQSTVGASAQIGPFAHLRAESHIEATAHVGNFVETKKTTIRKGAKANHLAYLGDSDIGEGANVGAGTIFCNYDGFRKHRTEIGAGAFIGSDSQLIAPVKIGAGAYVATGTTITRDVPDDAMAIGRVRQENREGYATKLRARLKEGKK